jgi:hypothetical protein
MNKETWKIFDREFHLNGFGGYYDVIECLKQSILTLKPELVGIEKLDFFQLLILLNRIIAMNAAAHGEETT